MLYSAQEQNSITVPVDHGMGGTSSVVVTVIQILGAGCLAIKRHCEHSIKGVQVELFLGQFLGKRNKDITHGKKSSSGILEFCWRWKR